MTENGNLPDFLKDAQAGELIAHGITDKQSVRAVTDEDLTAITGVGLATAIKLREWSVEGLPEGSAISKRYLVLTVPGKKKIDEDGKLEIRPGDIIPPEFEPEQFVREGKAVWQHQQGT